MTQSLVRPAGPRPRTGTGTGTGTGTRTGLTLDRLGPSFGAEVLGLDVRTASDAQVAALREALVEHKVLFLRGQDLTATTRWSSAGGSAT